MAGYLYGWFNTLIGVVGTIGQSYGQQATPAVNTMYNAYRAKRPKTANLAPADPGTLDFTGGDRLVARTQVGNAMQGPFDMVLQDYDPALVALIGSSNDNTTANTSFELFSENNNLTAPLTFWVALTQRYQDVAVGSGGPDKYLTTIFPRTTMRAKRGPVAYQAESPLTIRVTPTFTDHFINGMTYDTTAGSGLAMGLEDNITEVIHVLSSYPLFVSTFISNAAATTFTPGPLPVSNVVTLGATPNWFARNGTPAALTSANTSTGVMTMASAGSSSDVNVLIYQVYPNYRTA